MIILVWNCRGIGRSSVVRSLRVLVKTHKSSVVFLSELKTSSFENIQKILLPLGFPFIEFVPAIGRSGRLALCWKSDINLQVVLSNPSLVNVMLLSDPPHHPWQLSLIYGPPISCLRAAFWDSLMDLDNAWSGPWCLLGDFNSLLDQVDKQGGRLLDNQLSLIGLF